MQQRVDHDQSARYLLINHRRRSSPRYLADARANGFQLECWW
jgi:hypothetical protein